MNHLPGLTAGLTLLVTGCSGGSASPPQPIIVSVSPMSVTTQAGMNQLFTASVQNDPANQGVTWMISPATGMGTLSGASSTTVTYTAPRSAPNNLSVTITATSVTDTSKSASATIAVPGQSGITVSVNPPTAMVAPGAAVGFTATVGNDPSNSGVNWTISPATAGGELENLSTVSGVLNLYTAPASLTAPSLSVIVVATSVADGTKSASIAITVSAGIVVIVSASSWAFDNAPFAMTQLGGTVPLSATVSNDATAAGVTWSIGGCTGGTSLCGVVTNVANPSSGSFTADYVAPQTVPPGGKLAVVATSVTDPSASASVAVTISPIRFTSQNYPAGNVPSSVAVADFNGDGKPDVAVVDYGNPSTGGNGGVSLLLGNGDGTFQPAKLASAGLNPISIAVGDLNDDGKQDFVVTNYGNRSSGGSGSVSVCLGNGDGTFQAALALSTGVEPFVVLVGDVNGDKRLDILVSDYGSGGVYLLMGNGDGTFQPSTLINTGNKPSAMTAGDFNGDGYLDLAVAGAPQSGSSSSISLLLGHGDGTFSLPVPYSINEFLPTAVAVADLDSNGKEDLVTSSYACVFGVCRGPITALNGNGDGTFQSAQNLPFPAPTKLMLQPPGITLALNTGDFDADGNIDLVEATGPDVALIVGNGDGTFQGVLYLAADQNPYALAIADVNGDGKVDIVVANKGSNDITVLLNAPAPK
jgi:hypothetical protein